MTSKRKKAYRAGFRAELIAALYLMARGYRVLARRYKTPVGEIDLIVARRNRLAFVEVKGRAGSVEALCAVTPRQQQRIRRAASHYLSKRNKPLVEEIGFDVITIAPWKRPRYYRDVFPHTIY